MKYKKYKEKKEESPSRLDSTSILKSNVPMWLILSLLCLVFFFVVFRIIGVYYRGSLTSEVSPAYQDVFDTRQPDVDKEGLPLVSEPLPGDQRTPLTEVEKKQPAETEAAVVLPPQLEGVEALPLEAREEKKRAESLPLFTGRDDTLERKAPSFVTRESYGEMGCQIGNELQQMAGEKDVKKRQNLYSVIKQKLEDPACKECNLEKDVRQIVLSVHQDERQGLFSKIFSQIRAGCAECNVDAELGMLVLAGSEASKKNLNNRIQTKLSHPQCNPCITKSKYISTIYSKLSSAFNWPGNVSLIQMEGTLVKNGLVPKAVGTFASDSCVFHAEYGFAVAPGGAFGGKGALAQTGGVQMNLGGDEVSLDTSGTIYEAPISSTLPGGGGGSEGEEEGGIEFRETLRRFF